MAGLSFGNTFNAANSSLGGLSLGTSVLRSPTDFQYRKSPVAKSPTDFQYKRPTKAITPVNNRRPLSFGGSVPSMSTTGTKLSMPASVPKVGAGGLGNFLKTFSLGVPVSAMSTGRSNTGFLPSVPQIDTVTLAGGSNAADAAKNLASQIFGDMLQPAAFGGGNDMGGGSNGQSAGGFFDEIGFAEIAMVTVGLGVVFMLVSGGGSKRRRA